MYRLDITVVVHTTNIHRFIRIYHIHSQDFFIHALVNKLEHTYNYDYVNLSSIHIEP